VEIINKKAVLSQGNRVYLPIHLMSNDSSIVIYIYCIKADVNVKP